MRYTGGGTSRDNIRENSQVGVQTGAARLQSLGRVLLCGENNKRTILLSLYYPKNLGNMKE